MAQPARRDETVEEPPRYDPRNIQRALLQQRARRRARLAHKRAKTIARIRFFVVILALLGLAFYLGLTVWREVQHLFGL